MTIRLLHQVTLLFLAVGTAQASSTLIFPRLSFGPRDLIGVAIVYPGEGVVDVTFTAYGDSGQLLAGAGFTNPAVRQIREIVSIGALAGLNELKQIFLIFNQISDIAPLVANPGVGAGDFVGLNGNPLDEDDCPNLDALMGRGANVDHDVECP